MCAEKPDVKDSAITKEVSIAYLRSAFFWVEVARKTVQLLSFILFNAAFLGLPLLPIVLPVLQSLGSPNKIIGEAFGTIQWMLSNLVFPWLPLASIFLFAVLTGRFLCGWVCPFGLLQDMLSYAKKKKTNVSSETHKDMVSVKYLILGLTLLICGVLAASSTIPQGQIYREALGVFAEAPFTALSPSDTLFAVVPRIALGIWYQTYFYVLGYEGFFAYLLSTSPLLWVRIIIMVAVLVSAVYIPRVWCRYFCPQGALSALISRFSFLGLRREPVKCVRAGCRACVDACPMKVPIMDLPWEKFTDPECIYCLRCVAVCPTKAIKPKFP